MRKPELLSGIVGVFEIISFEGTRGKSSYYQVKCLMCGNIKSMRRDGIKNSNSCGCVRGTTTHGLFEKGPMYFMWHDMKNRCYNPKADRYNRYGDRGIIVCDEWKNDYKSFHDWALSNGWKKGLQIDRKDNDGNYTPDNCQFLTPKQNSRKRGNTVWVNYNSKKVCLSEICDELGFNTKRYKSIHRYMNMGMYFEDAVLKSNKPVNTVSYSTCF